MPSLVLALAVFLFSASGTASFVFAVKEAISKKLITTVYYLACFLACLIATLSILRQVFPRLFY